MALKLMDVHNDLQEHKREDMAFHSEVREIKGDIKVIKENHLSHIQDSMTAVQTNMAWLLKFFWIFATLTTGAILTAIFSLILKR